MACANGNTLPFHTVVTCVRTAVHRPVDVRSRFRRLSGPSRWPLQVVLLAPFTEEGFVLRNRVKVFSGTLLRLSDVVCAWRDTFIITMSSALAISFSREDVPRQSTLAL